MAAHSTLTGANLHEPKGVASASANTVYLANGAGSGAWTNLVATIKNANKIYLWGRFLDISAASSVFLPSPLAGTITNVTVTLQGAITVANSVVTGKIAGVAITGLSITITQAGSAAGSTFSDAPSAANTLTAGQVVEIITDGGSTTTVEAIICVEVTCT